MTDTPAAPLERLQIETLREVLRKYWTDAGHDPSAPMQLCDLALAGLALRSDSAALLAVQVQLRTQLAQCVSVLAGQDMTRHEVMVEESRRVLRDSFEALKKAAPQELPAVNSARLPTSGEGSLDRKVEKPVSSSSGVIDSAQYPAGAAPSAQCVSAAPVAWRYRFLDTGHWRYVETKDECNPREGYQREPLYAETPNSSDATVPCVVVPMDPTEAMLEAAYKERNSIFPSDDLTMAQQFTRVYKAMLAAAPSQSEREGK